MKQFFFGAAFLGAGMVSAQNTVPVISNLSAVVDAGQHKVTLTFDLADAENDTLEVSLAASDNEGQTYFVAASSLTGHVGFPVMPGNGKQIVWDYSALTGPSGAYRLKVVADDRRAVSIQEMVNQVDSMRLHADMDIIEGTRHYSAGAAHLAEVKDTIFGRFGQYGLAPYYQNFQFNSYQAQNIIGKKAGQVAEDTVFIVDGHYDSVDDGPGADDNASAVIGVLEAARILSQYEFRRSIRFIGFDLEELGLRGSQEYVNNGILTSENVAGVLNFEMIGYYSERNNSQVFPPGFNLLFPAAYAIVSADTFKGNFITNVANTSSSGLKQVFDACAATYVPALKVVSIEAPGNGELTQDLRRSDHAPFWDEGTQALMLTDGAEFRNHNYHTPLDVSDSLNFAFIQNVVKATVGTLAELAGPIHADWETVDVNLPNVDASIADNTPQEWMAITPNPGNEKMTVRWGLDNGFTQISVTDMHGNTVYASPVSATAGQHVLHTEAFTAGMYVVKMYGKTGEFSRKIVVSH